MAGVKRVKLEYTATPTGARFHGSRSFVRGVLGPVRSGKSTMMTNELFSRMSRQAPFNGLRKTRWAVIRNTYGELQDTTLKTWLDWWSEDRFGAFNHNEMTHRIKFRDVEAEVLFRALDRPKDIKKLLSLELTGAWVNEAREIPRPIIEALIDRVGQYPPKREGGSTWFGVMMDTNPPDSDHWWYKLFEEARPDGWELFKQPGALIEQGGRFHPNPHAENLDNLAEGIDYYLRRLAGKSLAHIRVYYCSQYGFVVDGKPVHPDYADHFHASTELLQPDLRLPCIVGLDFGLTPAAVFLQKLGFNRWIAFDEIVATDMGAARFAKTLKAFIAANYPKHKFAFYGDPAGDIRAQTDETTPYQILQANGITASPVWTNDVTIRREALAEPLRRLVDGYPGLLISPKCRMLRKGLQGGFCYKRVEIAGEERYHDVPVKNEYSHVVEACEYGMIGGGEGEKLITAPDDGRPRQDNYLTQDPNRVDYRF
jgi:hypothetical protein